MQNQSKGLLGPVLLWIGDMFLCKQYTYRSAEIYVPTHGLLPGDVTEMRLQSDSSNIRQDCQTKEWQIRHVNSDGSTAWDNLSSVEVESVLIPAFSSGTKPVFRFCMTQ
jgi:hypothetical protein